MEPCIYCHRRGVIETASGTLCSACADDAADESREAFESQIDMEDMCVFPNLCGCAECRALEEYVLDGVA